MASASGIVQRGRARCRYRLTFDSRVTRVDGQLVYAVEATGELQGRGVWTFSSEGAETRVRYDWNVDATEWWMRLLAPIARRLFEWNHDVIMRWGQEGLVARLASDPAESEERK